MKLRSQCATSFFDVFCLLAQVLVAELHKFSGSNTFFRDLVKQDMFENQHSSWISRNCSFPAYCKKSFKSNCAMSCCDIYVYLFCWFNYVQLSFFLVRSKLCWKSSRFDLRCLPGCHQRVQERMAANPPVRRRL